MTENVEICCVGLNHRTAPVELREKVAFNAEQVESALKELVRVPGVREAVLLSTCNRVELYVAGPRDHTPRAVAEFLHRFHGLGDAILDEHLFHRGEEEAIRHLFRVAAALDSIVVGEPQILGQVKDAFFRAVTAGTTGALLSRTFHRAFTTAKRVRTETRVASNAVSVSYAGVELARKIFGDLAGLSCLLVGAGEMGELAARHFANAGAKVIVANRSLERAHRLAEQVDGVARELAELPGLLVTVDVVLVSTGAPTFVITHEMAKRAHKGRRYRPLLLVDISVPRNVDPGVAEIDGFYVYDVDDLGAVVEENLTERKKEAAKAERIVQDELEKSKKARRELAAVPLIRALRDKMAALALVEAEKTLAVLGETATEKQKKSVQAMAQAIVNKMLHEPTARLREAAGVEAEELLLAAAALFGVEPAEQGAADDAQKALLEAAAAEEVRIPEPTEARQS